VEPAGRLEQLGYDLRQVLHGRHTVPSGRSREMGVAQSERADQRLVEVAAEWHVDGTRHEICEQLDANVGVDPPGGQREHPSQLVGC
jgi:hypothetical protein